MPRLCTANRRDQDDEADRHHVGLEGRRHELQALDRREHRDRRRDDGVAIEQRRADHAEQRRRRQCCWPSARCASAISDSVPPSPLLSARRTSSTYLSVTMMISAQRISETHAEHHLARQRAAAGGRAAARLSLQRVERAGADVAVDDADGAERQGPEGGRGRVPSYDTSCIQPFADSSRGHGLPLPQRGTGAPPAQRGRMAEGFSSDGRWLGAVLAGWLGCRRDGRHRSLAIRWIRGDRQPMRRLRHDTRIQIGQPLASKPDVAGQPVPQPAPSGDTTA